MKTSNTKGIAPISQQQEAYIDGIAEEFELKDKKRGRTASTATETPRRHGKSTTNKQQNPKTDRIAMSATDTNNSSTQRKRQCFTYASIPTPS